MVSWQLANLKFRVCILLVLFSITAPQSYAKTPLIEQELTQTCSEKFALEAQPLADVLPLLANKCNITLAYDPIWAEQVISPPLHGDFSPFSALSIVLAEQAVQLQQVANGWVIKPIIKPVTANLIPTPAEAIATIEEVLVVARYSDSLNKAMADKFFAHQQKDIMHADNLGKLPAVNLADALNSKPGVAVERDRGEALFLSINGLPSEFNQLTINALPVATNENSRTSEQYGSRFHYDLMPIELAQSVEINKTAMASDYEGAIGGSVNITTHQPLNSARQSRHNQLKLALTHSTLANKNGYDLAWLHTWLNEQNTFGITAIVNLAQKHIRQDRFLTFDWLSDKLYYAGNMRPTLENELRQNQAASLSMQWQITEQLEWMVNYIHLQQKVDYTESSYSADYSLQDLNFANLSIVDNKLLAGATNNGAVQIGYESTQLANSSYLLDNSLNWLNGNWQSALIIRLSNAASATDEPIKRTRFRIKQGVEFSFELPENYHSAKPSLLYHNIDLTDASLFPGRRLEWRDIETTDQLKLIKLQTNYTNLFNWLDSTEVGIQFIDHARRYQRFDNIYQDEFYGETFAQQHFAYSQQNFLSQFNQQLPTKWLVPDENYFWQQFANEQNNQNNVSNLDLLNHYQVKDSVLSAYFQLNAEFSNWWANLGVRLIHTKQTSQGYFTQDDTPLAPQPIQFNQDYTHTLPALNIAYKLGDDWILRSAFSRAIKRPDEKDIAPRLTLNSGDTPTAEGGNPYLKPVLAWQFDFAVEKYQEHSGYIAANAFYKRLDSFIQPAISKLNINNTHYQLSSNANGGKARVFGMSFAYQQQFALDFLPDSRLGFSTNFTVARSHAEYKFNDFVQKSVLPDVARHSFSAEFYYESSKFNLTTSYNWSDRILLESATSEQPARYRAPFSMLTTRLSTQLNTKTEIYLEAFNLLNQAEIDYVLDDKLANYTYYGRSIRLGFVLKL
ncbi:TonB-dependent receptor [Catenovulum sp. SX2]|uniref:TonB-dependent receptor n=1 Tax=Catenovulum sp. SX2 TaxID=3398614 RepID=UPI003F849120